MKLAKPMATGFSKTFPTMKPEAVQDAAIACGCGCSCGCYYLCVYYCTPCSSCGCVC